MCHAGWTHYLASLVAYVDTGEGQPSRTSGLIARQVGSSLAPVRATRMAP